MDEIKYSGTTTSGSRRMLEDKEASFAEARARFERNRDKFERVAKVLVGMKAGCNHISEMLQVVSLESLGQGDEGSNRIEVTQTVDCKLSSISPL